VTTHEGRVAPVAVERLDLSAVMPRPLNLHVQTVLRGLAGMTRQRPASPHCSALPMG
jgi:hypothetical protein